MRIYDPRVGRFLSMDPLTKSYPWYTPYQFAGNKPIWAVDLDGLEEIYFQDHPILSFSKDVVLKVLNSTKTYKNFLKQHSAQNKLDIYVKFVDPNMQRTLGADGVTQIYNTLNEFNDDNDDKLPKEIITFDHGKELAVITLSSTPYKIMEQYFLDKVYPINYKNNNKLEKYSKNDFKYFLSLAAQTYIHEFNAHIVGLEDKGMQDHKDYNNRYGIYSPENAALLIIPEYKYTKARSDLMEIIDVIDKIYPSKESTKEIIMKR